MRLTDKQERQAEEVLSLVIDAQEHQRMKRFVLEPDSGAPTLYGLGKYERRSVLAGQAKRQWLFAFDQFGADNPKNDEDAEAVLMAVKRRLREQGRGFNWYKGQEAR